MKRCLRSALVGLKFQHLGMEKPKSNHIQKRGGKRHVDNSVYNLLFYHFVENLPEPSPSSSPLGPFKCMLNKKRMLRKMFDLKKKNPEPGREGERSD